MPLAAVGAGADDEVAVLLGYCDVAWAGMAAILTELGDDGANVRPYAGANSPYGLLTHCLGMAGWWGGHALAGRVVDRDRDAEFVASGRVAPLLARVGPAREQLRADLAGYAPLDPPRLPVGHDDGEPPPTQRSCLVHLFEELAQHHGQLETLRDVITAR